MIKLENICEQSLPMYKFVPKIKKNRITQHISIVMHVNQLYLD